MDPNAKEELMYRTWDNSLDHAFRGYNKHTHSNDPDDANTAVGIVFSEWISLEKDQHYYIEAQHKEYSGNDHYTIGVEIQPDNPDDIPDDHPMLTSYYQKLQVDTELTREKA